MQDYRKESRHHGQHKRHGGQGHNANHAGSFDEARMMANVNTRAGRLYYDGYRAKRLTAHTIRITSPEQVEYVVDQVNQDCECPFFTKREGKYPCKHLLGADQLLADQQEAQRQNSRQWAALAGIIPQTVAEQQRAQEGTQ